MNVALYTIGFGRPDLLFQQKRLLDKYLKDDFGLCLIDNTQGLIRNVMEKTCKENGIGYLHTPGLKSEHDDGLNFAVSHIAQQDHEYFGFLDADIFPTRQTTIIDKTLKSGFYGISQTHFHTGKKYLWPGLCFFSQEWVNGRPMNFSGIRGIDKREDGDCGSMLHTLFNQDDWNRSPLVKISYGSVRYPLNENEEIQSWGYELFGDWIHLMNSSHWLAVPKPEERDRLLMEMVTSL